MEMETKNPGTAGAAAGVQEKTNRYCNDSAATELRQSAAGEVVRVILRRVPWPSLVQRPNRESFSLTWDVLTEDGELIVVASPEPLNQATHTLLSRGLPPETLFTTRREGSVFDAWAAHAHRGTGGNVATAA